MTELIDIIINAVDQASETFDSIVSSAEEAAASITDMGNATGEVDSTPIEETKTQTEETGAQADTTTGAFENLNSVIEGLAGAEAFSSIADGLMAAADAAGTYEDSMMRAGLEAEGAGISADTMANTFSHLSDETGRAGGQIREAFITATARGITDTDSFTKMMEGAGAQATLFGTDIQSMGNKFSQMAMRSTLMERGLASTGITMEELATAMGMTGATADEVKAKWSELDANQRAAILGTAASMNEGEEANEAYKTSWAGLQDQIEIGKGRLLRLAGEVLLPVLIPAMQLATRVMDWLGDTISATMDGPLGGLISVIGSVAAGFALAIPAIMAIKAGLVLFEAAIWPAVTASWELLAPWLPFIAIGAAIVLIIYEIGKAFTWWDNPGEMIDAIWAGIQRLWSAFINHPDVQAIIQALTDAWNWLLPAVTGVVQAIMDFFGINEQGNFDFVRSLIDALGQAWNALTFPIRAVIGLVQAVINVFNMFSSGQITLPGLIMTVWNIITGFIANIFSTIINAAIRFGAQMIQQAVSAARGFVNGIINRIKALPGRVYSALLSVVSRIVSAGQQWVSNAKQKASDVVNGAYNTLAGLPGKVASALGGVVDAIVAPFKKAYEDAKGWWDKITSLDIGGTAGFDLGNTAGFDLGDTAGFDLGSSSGNTSSSENHETIDVNYNISLDLSSVPGGMNTTELINALTDKNVLAALTGNRDFQTLDAKVKSRINQKNSRAYGRGV